jgi:hypothetical protein
MGGLQDNQSTRVKVITYHLVEATSKEVGPTTWVCFTKNPQRKKEMKSLFSFFHVTM